MSAPMTEPALSRPLGTQPLTPDETAIINQLQNGFPLQADPFTHAGSRVGMNGAALRDTLADLLHRKILTRFGPLYQIERMGGRFVLAALQVPEERYAEVTEKVNALQAVAHNYRREHALNMWFVLATATPQGMQQAIGQIGHDTGLQVHAFPKLEEYFVGMRFTVGGEHPAGQQQAAAARVQDAPVNLTGFEQQLVRATQAGLPLVDEPYRAIASQLACSEDDVIGGLQHLLARWVIRRIGVVPNHYAIGYRYNAMAVFDVDDGALPQWGPQVGALDFVTHCYRRPRHLPLWPYNLFAMCHGASRDAVLAQVGHIRTLLGAACHSHTTLFSTHILKKTGLRV